LFIARLWNVAGWFIEPMPVPSKVTAPPVPAAKVPEPVRSPEMYIGAESLTAPLLVRVGRR